MKKSLSLHSTFCVAFLIVFIVFMFWYIPSMSSLQAKKDKVLQELETSQGRERKQQQEYEKAVEEFPLVQAELSEKEPLAEEAEHTVSELKARRKALREEKQILESGHQSGMDASDKDNLDEEVFSDE